MSNRYHPYSFSNPTQRRRVQEQMLKTLNNKPVAEFKATCAVCLDTYKMQSHNITDFLMSSNCTHAFCYKCVLNMYCNTMNIPRATIDCPMCKVNVTTWRSCFPNAVVSCKFIKKTGDRVPPCQQFVEAVQFIKQRCAADADDDEPAVSQNNKLIQQETERLQKTVDKHKQEAERLQEIVDKHKQEAERLQETVNKYKQEGERLQEIINCQKRQHDIAWSSSCEQVLALQNKLIDLQAQLDKSKTFTQTLADQNRTFVALFKVLQNFVNHENQQHYENDENDEHHGHYQLEIKKNVAVNVEFNENARQKTNLHEQFRSRVYSTVADMMIEDRIKSLQTHVFGIACLPCSVNINVSLPFDDE
ncbi:Pe38 protein [Spilosoma obliqua nucleopolyhedrosis virus]|nr:Pe38 protein [Spilosoma obliqua nucleopolyhedrosis virus]